MQRPTADFKSNTTRMQKQEEKFEYGIVLYCIYLFPKIPYTGMYPRDVGIVNKLAH